MLIMKGILDKFTNWVMRTFCTVHYVHHYNGEKLEYQVVSEVVKDRATIDKTNQVLAKATHDDQIAVCFDIGCGKVS